jgi:hypothetical protein
MAKKPVAVQCIEVLRTTGKRCARNAQPGRYYCEIHPIRDTLKKTTTKRAAKKAAKKTAKRK